MYCLRHSLNNMLGSSVFTVDDLNAASAAVDGQQPAVEPGLLSRLIRPLYSSSSVALFGNFDVNTLIVAGDRKGFEIRWSSAKSFRQDILREGFLGIILNEASRGLWGQLTKSRHWTSCRKVEGEWFYCDSNLNAPTLVAGRGREGGDADEEAIATFVEDQVEKRGSHVFVALRRAL